MRDSANKSAYRLIRLVAFLSIAGLCLGNECGSSTTGPGGSGGSAGSGGTAGSSGGSGGSIEGRYIERYSCRFTEGNCQATGTCTCAEVDVRIELEVTSLPNSPLEGDQYRIEDLGSNAATTTARLIGNGLEWRSEDPDFPGFVERGLWTFDFSGGSTTFEKESVFGQADGTLGECVGSGILASDGEPDPPPPLPCVP